MPVTLLGLGLNFYGFFAFAALWICGYFGWVRRANAQDEAEPPADNPGPDSGTNHPSA